VHYQVPSSADACRLIVTSTGNEAASAIAAAAAGYL